MFSGVDPGGGEQGGRSPPIKKYQGESIFSPPKVLSCFFLIFQCTVGVYSKRLSVAVASVRTV